MKDLLVNKIKFWIILWYLCRQLVSQSEESPVKGTWVFYVSHHLQTDWDLPLKRWNGVHWRWLCFTKRNYMCFTVMGERADFQLYGRFHFFHCVAENNALNRVPQLWNCLNVVMLNIWFLTLTFCFYPLDGWLCVNQKKICIF